MEGRGLWVPISLATVHVAVWGVPECQSGTSNVNNHHLQHLLLLLF